MEGSAMASCYLKNIFSVHRTEYENIIKKVRRKVKTLVDQTGVDTLLVFTGVSGMAVGFPVTRSLKLRPVVVRKTIKGTHGYNKVEMDGEPTGKFIIIDDCIDTGKTIRRVLKEIETYRSRYYRNCPDEQVDSPLKCIGIVLYNHIGSFHGNFKTKSSSIPVYCVT